MKTPIAVAAFAIAVALPAAGHASAASEGLSPSVEELRTAPPLPTPRWGATAIRLDLSDQLFGGSLTGVEVSHRFPAPFGLDLAVGQNDMGHGHTGLAVDAMGRLYLFNESSGGVSIGGGPSFRAANEFGIVGFMTGELAAEYRPRGGISVLVGTGMSVALNDSGQAQCPSNGWFDCFLWTDHYTNGDKTVNLRLAVGASF